ncbi:ATP-binding cassette domain-containing protein [Lachnospiraceae bacterium HCP1S3_C3]
MEKDYIIEVNNLNLTIKKDRILNNINLQLEPGKIHGLIGRNGSGKTMLMKCICGFVRPTSGQVKVEGRIIGKDVDFPQNVGIIIETPGFVPYYSGYRNLKILADLRRKISKEEVLRTMEEVGLKGAENKAVRKYSLGMRQRLGLAQAIMENPDILILDEPMNGLDKEGVADIRAILLKLKKSGKTILLVSHNSEDIGVLCDDIYEIEHGNISFNG